LPAVIILVILKIYILLIIVSSMNIILR
jgi:hypothetical protein